MTSTWMPREKWDAMVSGALCPMCQEIADEEEINEYGITVAEMRTGIFRFATNQVAAGYCVLIAKKHVREPYELPDSDRRKFFEDLSRASQVIDTIYRPDKMNLLMMGTAVPHLHCHIIPRRYGDALSPNPLVYLAENEERLESLDEYLEQVDIIRRFLKQA